MFASRVKKDIVIKDDDGNDIKVKIRKLSGTSLDKAAEAYLISVTKMATGLGKEAATMFREAAKDEAASAEIKKKAAEMTPAEKRKKLFEGYDRDSVLVAGIESWESDVPVLDGIKDLDKETCDLLKTAILDLSIPDEEVVVPKG